MNVSSVSRYPSLLLIFCLASITCLFADQTEQADQTEKAYYLIPASELTFTTSAAEKDAEEQAADFNRAFQSIALAHFVTSQPLTAHVTRASLPDPATSRAESSLPLIRLDGEDTPDERALALAIHAPIDSTIELTIGSIAPYRDHDDFHTTIDLSKHQPTEQATYQHHLFLRYHSLAFYGDPGASHFSFLAHHYAPTPDQDASPENTAEQSLELQRLRNRARVSQLANTTALFSGSQGLSENLALDRDLILARISDEESSKEASKKHQLSSLEGITVEAIDWQPFLAEIPEGQSPAIDPLAHSIPHDQHAIILRDLPTLLRLMDTLETEGMPVFQAFSARNPFRGLAQRYRKQLGFDLPNTLAQQLPVKSAAITGSDPFYPTGTDLTILLETESEAKAKALYFALSARIKHLGTTYNIPATAHDVSFPITSYQSADRSLSSHLALLGSGDQAIVVLTNSAQQIFRLHDTQTDQIDSLASLEEYTYFRHRYPMANDRDAYLFISDPTLRRWCGPHLRIAASRRIRAIAALQELTSTHLVGQTLPDTYAPLLGSTAIRDDIPHSEHFNTLHFTTPSAELTIDQITYDEKLAYQSWKSGYESGWRTVFDPIAIELDTQSNYQVDLSILPLRTNSEYDRFKEFVGDTYLSDKATHIHPNSALHFALAIDKDSNDFVQFNSMLNLQLGDVTKPLGWIGDSASFTLLGGPQLDQFITDYQNDDLDKDELINDIPLYLRIDSQSGIKLALFLAGAKGFIESSAPGLIEWTNHQHGDHPYVAMTDVTGEIDEDFKLFYAPTKTALIFSINEDTLKAAIDHEHTALPEDQSSAYLADSQLLLDTTPEAIAKLQAIGYELVGQSLDQRRQQLAYRTLPILNHWQQRFPDTDPVLTHYRYFGIPLHSPGSTESNDSGYTYDADSHQVISTHYGTPLMPKLNAQKLPIMKDFQRIISTLNFKNDGLRLRAELERNDNR